VGEIPLGESGMSDEEKGRASAQAERARNLMAEVAGIWGGEQVGITTGFRVGRGSNTTTKDGLPASNNDGSGSGL